LENFLLIPSSSAFTFISSNLQIIVIFVWSLLLTYFFYYFFFNSLNGGWSPTGSTRQDSHWLAYCSLPRVTMMMENLVEWRLAKETKVLGEDPPQCHFVHHKSHLTRPRIEPGPLRCEASD
jgi:hypothetical protein